MIKRGVLCDALSPSPVPPPRSLPPTPPTPQHSAYVAATALWAVGLVWTFFMPTAALTASASAATARGNRTITSARASEGGDAAAVVSLAPPSAPLRTWASAPASDLESAAAASERGSPSGASASSRATVRASWAGSLSTAPPPHAPTLPALLSPRLPLAPSTPPPGATTAAAAVASPSLPPSTTAAKLRALATNPDAAIFFATAAAFGVGVGAVDSWLFVLLDELRATRILMSATLVVTVAAEVPVFFYAGRLIDRVGVTPVLHLVYAAFLIRLGGYVLLPSLATPWLVLPFETLNAVTFGSAFAAGTTACSRLAPPGLAATMQALFNAAYSGVGYGIGSLVGGLVHARAGARWVFAATAAIIAVAWVATTTASAVVDARRRRRVR